MYFSLWGVSFISDYGFTLLPGSVSLVRALNVCLVFFCVRREKPRLDFPFFLSPCRWRRRLVPGFSLPLPVGAWVRRIIIYYVFIAV